MNPSFVEWIIILLFCYMVFKNLIPSLVSYITGKPTKPPRELHIDIMNEVVKQKMKVARLNGRNLPHRIKFVTDGDVPPQTHKIIGLNPSTKCTEIVWKSGFFKKRMVIVPNELIVDYMSNIILIRCRGFTLYGGVFYRPIFNNKVEKEKRNSYLTKIDDHITEMCNFVINVNAKENNLNSAFMASKTEYVPRSKLLHYAYVEQKEHDYPDIGDVSHE